MSNTWTPLLVAAGPAPFAATLGAGFCTTFAFSAAFFWRSSSARRSFSSRSFSTYTTRILNQQHTTGKMNIASTAKTLTTRLPHSC
jgi:hypothetical protein